VTAADAEMHYRAYLDAIERLGPYNAPGAGVMDGMGVSIKLSALSPRLEMAQLERVRAEVIPRVRELVRVAREHNVSLTLDAEEASRLELLLLIFDSVYRDAVVGDWEGFGVVVQAYQRRGMAVIDWLQALATDVGRLIPVRLVKGAYWDAEVKRAQEAGWPGYPVFTRKVNSDIAFLAGVRRLFARDSRLWPQFATHNAHALAYIIEHAPPGRTYEFQRLHGMGEPLFDHLAERAEGEVPVRIYAPVGEHEDLLPYLVRRLLENGSNTSFVNRIVDEKVPPLELVRQPAPVDAGPIANPQIPAPPDLFGAARRNSDGFNFYDGGALAELADEMTAALARPRRAASIVDGERRGGTEEPVTSPADRRVEIGRVAFASRETVERAIAGAVAAFPAWNATPVERRADCLRRAADLFEQHRAELFTLCIAEAGKCLPDAVSEVREAIDFLRYYAAEAERLMGRAERLPGPTGESNELSMAGRGTFVCISPWNFPVAIYTGQIAAALVTGNTVLAKPAEQTSLTGARIAELLHEAGIPPRALQFVPGHGAEVGARAVSHPAIAGVVFTGSTETAQSINRALAARDGAIGTLIAETGGQNAMVVDSTALAQQVVLDAAQSAFNSAGQRCSALRVLFVQDDIADRIVELLRGHMAELTIGDAARLATDVGPVIDDDARDVLRRHRDRILAAGRLIYECALPKELEHGCFFAPLAVEIDSLDILEREVFGPVLHVIRYDADDLDAVMASIGRLGYGLTFGVQTRIERRSRELARRIGVGNVYVNRNMIGAVVGVQPFGGQGLSGTGPKAGGPHYLLRFVTEKTVCVNTAAVGGNATLLAGSDLSK
jgi:RHH-type proline utilization regulon transcriptional repressor/proline dehydrogenase/delta 1-pyrroline-5-carboxylate dehydrogenase